MGESKADFEFKVTSWGDLRHQCPLQTSLPLREEILRIPLRASSAIGTPI